MWWMHFCDVYNFPVATMELAAKPVGFNVALYWSTIMLHAWHGFHKMSVKISITYHLSAMILDIYVTVENVYAGILL